MRYHQGFGNCGFAADATGGAAQDPSISRIFKWVMALIIACLFMASAVCRAHDGHDHTTTDPVITDPAPTPIPFIDAGQGRLYNDIEMMGIYGSVLPPDSGGGDQTEYVPTDNPFLTTTGECQVPTVPLPAAVWAGFAGGAIVLGRGRRRRRC